MIRSSLIVLILPLACMTSCAPPSAIDHHGNPVAHGASSSLRSEGASAFQQLKKKKRIVTNSRYTAPVNRVAARLKRVIPLKNAQWEFVVIDDKTPNAFALPGGKVGIHTGLFHITQNDAGLAAVLAHEITHVTANHAGGRRKQQTGIAIGGALLDAVLSSRGVSDGSRSTASDLFKKGSALGVALPHSRKQELEADRVGMIYMAKAGYDPREAVNLWKRFAAYNRGQGASTPEFLRTHPLDTTRIVALQESLPEAQTFYHSR